MNSTHISTSSSLLPLLGRAHCFGHVRQCTQLSCLNWSSTAMESHKFEFAQIVSISKYLVPSVTSCVFVQRIEQLITYFECGASGWGSEPGRSKSLHARQFFEIRVYALICRGQMTNTTRYTNVNSDGRYIGGSYVKKGKLGTPVAWSQNAKYAFSSSLRVVKIGNWNSNFHGV